jgi:hypothetical protein
LPQAGYGPPERGSMTEKHLDRIVDFIDAWSKPIAIWAMIFAAIYFGGILIFR